MNYGGIISGVSVSHTNASVDDIEAACHEDERTLVEDLLSKERVDEAFAIQTCNRAEAYVVTATAAQGFRPVAGGTPGVTVIGIGLYAHRHLGRLRSVVPGLTRTCSPVDSRTSGREPIDPRTPRKDNAT